VIVVLFEVTPHPEGMDAYLEIAASLEAQLRSIDGFVSVERFRSMRDPGKLLSLSSWRDDAALTAWRNREAHRNAQRIGRAKLFSDYRLRIAAVSRDYGLDDRTVAPTVSREAHG
jgi:heme-degrading monooxygenase HmoA